jgi:hypothetical protein
MNTRNKRGDHPSPAYGSPAAELIRGANGKRVSLFQYVVCHGHFQTRFVDVRFLFSTMA